MELTDSLEKIYLETAKSLQGAARRRFMAQIVKELGVGGYSLAQRKLGWCRDTVRKGMRELETGITCCDNYRGRGRRRAEQQLPQLLTHIQEIVASSSQIDPSFKTQRLYTRLSAKEVRRQLIEKKGYTEEELPTAETVRVKLNELGYYPRRVAKSKPQKKIPKTDAIFEQLAILNAEAEADPTVLRLSMDGKAAVNIGPFSRKGKNRIETRACDHDFQPTAKVTPQGIFLPVFNELFLYLGCSKITADFIVDTLEDCWKNYLSPRFPHVKTLLINQDNGPENHSRRTQFMKRMVKFAHQYQLNIRLAYYPPYHSKYNPIERTWATLEHHWNGEILDSIQTVVNFAQTMTWKGKHPEVKLVKQTYHTGVKLTPSEMKQVESHIVRFQELGRWFVDIFCL
ncbi:MAG: ISAzo13 family transposase [Spirulinaceae cyanobacterium]